MSHRLGGWVQMGTVIWIKTLFTDVRNVGEDRLGSGSGWSRCHSKALSYIN